MQLQKECVRLTSANDAARMRYIYGLLISEATVRLSSFPPHHHCDAGYTYFLNDIVCDCFDRIEALEMAAAQEQARMDTLRAAHARELEEQCRDRLSLEQKVSQSHRPSRLASVCSQSSPSSHPLSCETIKLGEERHTVESLRMSLKASEEKLSRLVRSLYRRDRERGIKQPKKILLLICRHFENKMTPIIMH